MLASLLSAVLLASPAPKVVIPEWTRVQVSAELSTFYAAHLAKELRVQGLQVITADELSTLLGLERQKQLLGCSDDAASCFAELGNALGCDGTVVVSLAQLDDTLQANLKVLSSSTGAVLAETSVEASSQRKLLSELSDAAIVLARAFVPATPPAPASATAQVSALRRGALIPALGGAALGVFGAVAIGVSKNDFDRLNNPLAVQTYDAATQLERSGRAFQVSSWAAFAVAATCLAVAAVMFLWGSAK